jgi:kinetochore protein Spc7/SPC105
MGGSKIALRTEEEQQAAAREREDRERREARRKSLANRRVSFAAEATLHTFHDIEYMQDSTTSTDSTRRASSLASTSPAPPESRSDRAHTPQDQVNHSTPESPENQRDLHQKKRRRSSGAASLGFNEQDDETMTTIYSSDSEPADAIEEINGDGDEDSNSSSDSDADDGTMMTMDADDMTAASVASIQSTSTTDETSTIDEALRLAARRAGTQRLDDDDESGEVIPSFVGWAKKPNQPTTSSSQAPTHEPDVELDEDQDEGDGMEMDMEMTRAVGGILKQSHDSGDDRDQDMSMDVTAAFGGILSQGQKQAKDGDRTRSIQENGIGEAGDDMTMDFTTAIGAIQRPAPRNEPEELDDNEDMSMELTTVVGGMLSAPQTKKARTRPQPTSQGRNTSTDETTMAMDMTVGLGRILPGLNDIDQSSDATLGMDMTMAIGGILKDSPSKSRAAAKQAMEEEAAQPDSLDEPQLASLQSPMRMHEPGHKANESAKASEMYELSAFHGKGLRRSIERRASTTPKSAKKARTPSPNKSTSHREENNSNFTSKANRNKGSPKRESPSRQLFPSAHTKTASPAKSEKTKSSIFQQNPDTGAKKPSVMLTPQRRRLSGVGVDREGLGSPRVAAIFDRRDSIGDFARGFVPGEIQKTRAVAFQDPKSIEVEVDRERRLEEDKENGRRILEREADGNQDERDATLNLKEMIQSLSPKRNILRGRKSLHVGSAKGVLGKRPAELDDDDDFEEKDGVKRLKGHQSSPVKNIRLKQPPSKAETTGRLTRAARKSLEENLATKSTPGLIQSPSRGVKGNTTPKSQCRYKTISNDQLSHQVDFLQNDVKDDVQLEDDVPEERIHLQDFLNMTSIRFMELTTTKRRHTQAPNAFSEGGTSDPIDDMSLERCVVAGACTVPMLELYQHVSSLSSSAIYSIISLLELLMYHTVLP